MLFAGCSDKEKSSGVVSNDVVFVRANGWDLTASSISNTVMVRARMSELARRPIPEEKFSFWANRFAMGSAAGLLQSHLLEEELHRRGITRTAASDAVVLSRYNRMTRMSCTNENQLAEKFGALEPTFRMQFARDSLFESFFSTDPACVVTEKDLVRRYQQLTNRVVRSRRIDCEAHEKADAAMKCLRAGEAWEVVASNVTEDALIEETYADNWQNWGSFKLRDLESEALIAALPKLKVGEITEPIEMDEGLIIVKIVELEDELYTLARILFRMGAKVEFPERDELKAQLAHEKRADFQRELLPTLRDQAKIEYPLGTNFVYKIWHEPELPADKRNLLKSRKRLLGK